MEKMTDISFEQYSEHTFRDPRYDPEAVFLARVGDEYVAMSTLHHWPAEPDTLMVGFTGTLPAYRGRGLATELKRRAVEFARTRGYQYLRTFNDSENPRIWAINQKIGFQVQRVWLMGEKRFGPGPGTAPLST
jgi:RimJ/RimL family protein N-acetyltransferase